MMDDDDDDKKMLLAVYGLMPHAYWIKSLVNIFNIIIKKIFVKKAIGVRTVT